MTQSRCTVRTVTPSASAISASLRPPKNRHSTTWARRGSICCEPLERLVELEQHVRLVLDGHGVVVEGHLAEGSAPLERGALSRAVHHDVAHGQRCQGEEMPAVAPLPPLPNAELEIGLVDQRGGRQGFVPNPGRDPPMGDGAELLIGERDGLIERALGAASYCRGAVGRWDRALQ